MKSTIKLVLFVSLFSSVAFADGDMGNGNKNCTTNCPGAIEQNEEKQPVTTESDDSILIIVQKYLISIFG